MKKSLLFTILFCSILSVSMGQQKPASKKIVHKSYMVAAEKKKMDAQQLNEKKASITKHEDRFANKKSFNKVDVIAQQKAAAKTLDSKN